MSIMIKGIKFPDVGVCHCVISFSDNHLLISDVCINWMNENGYTENCMYKERENNKK